MSYQLAIDPKTSPQRLAELARSEEKSIREAVAKNPNTSLKTLALLVMLDRMCASWVLQNPAFSLLVFGSNGLPEEFVEPPLAACRLLRHPEVPRALLYWAVGHEDAQLRRSVARNPKAPPELLLALQDDSDGLVRLAVAQHENTPQEAFYKLLTDEEHHVCKSAMKHPNAALLVERLGPSWQRFFCESVPEEAEHLIQSHPITPALREMFLRGGNDALLVLLYDPDVTEETLCAIALRVQNEDNIHTQGLWSRLVGHPKTPLAVCRMLIEDEIRRGGLLHNDVLVAFQNESLPEDLREVLLSRCGGLYSFAEDRRAPRWLLDRLRTHPDLGVRGSLAYNLALPDEVRAELLVQKNFRALLRIAGTLEYTPRLYWLAYQAGYPGVEPCSESPGPIQLDDEEILQLRRTLSYNAHTPEPVLRWLSGFPETKQNLLYNKALPQDLLLSLLQDADLSVVRRVVQRRELPEEWWEGALSGGSLELREVLLDGDVPDPIMARVEEDPTPEARRCAARQSARVEVLERLAKDPALRPLVASNPNAPDGLLRALFAFHTHEINVELVINRNTPPEVLWAIAKEEDPALKRDLASHPKTPPRAFFECELDIDLDSNAF